MRSLLAFVVIQLMIYFFGMSSTFVITLIVLGSAVTLFAGAYLSAFKKDKQHQQKSIKAALELQ